ncbi:MAG: hypothetical protein ACRCS9_11660, partial [Hyphomicrobium sp.]
AYAETPAEAPADGGATADGAASGATPDWPCVSRKVVEMQPAQLWDGPDLSSSTNWQDDDAVRKLSGFVISRRLKMDEVEAAIEKFAKGLADAERDKKLTDLFAAVLSRSNDDRKLVMSGIERFHKRQMARAKEIEKQGITLPHPDAELPDAPMPAGEIDKVSEEEDKFKWEVRVFQERQQNIPIACEIPQLIEERTGAIARAIRSHMKQ